MPQRINRAIELLSQRQPIYYLGAHTGHVLTYEQGKKDVKTWADYINVGMEHGAFNLAGLEQYLQGMVENGPTRSGHLTPAIIVEAPVEGTSREIVQFNAWQFRQILARGVHGILLCQAVLPEAVQAFVESCRYPVNRIGVAGELAAGTRGVGSESGAAHIWGIDYDSYLTKADPWPLNPEGELLLGIKIESNAAVPHIEELLAVPGIGFAEMGPGDMSLSLGYRKLPEPWPSELVEINERVQAACFANGVAFHETLIDDIQRMIDRGALVFTAQSEEFAKTGRVYSRRLLPV